MDIFPSAPRYIMRFLRLSPSYTLKSRKLLLKSATGRTTFSICSSRSSTFCRTHQREFTTAGGATARTFKDLSQRQLAELEDRVVHSIGSKVVDEILQRPIGSLQWLSRRLTVSENNSVQILLKLPSLLHPCIESLKDQVQQQAMNEIQEWINEKNLESFQNFLVNVEALAERPVPMMARLVEDSEEMVRNLGPGLAEVAHFVACYSCKGGVGKSSVAVNLAYELSRMGGRVGLLDVDVYGPSLPMLVKPKDTTVRRSPKGTGMVYPIEHEGVKLLSLGFVNTNSGVPGSGPKNGASIMRGPLTVKVIAQLLKGTDWGALDVLILDLPPGTGDVQLAICQDIQLSGAVGVTTPSRLALEDTRKGIEMFSSLGVPTFSVVENMSYFKGHDGTVYYPFGSSTREKTTFLPVDVFSLPLSEVANEANERGIPLTLSRPEIAHDHLSCFHDLAKKVSTHLLKEQYGDSSKVSYVTFENSEEKFNIETLSVTISKEPDDEKMIIRVFANEVAIQKDVHPAELRARDPKTGDLIPDSPFLRLLRTSVDSSLSKVASSHPEVTKVRGKRSPSCIPIRTHRRGRYGFGVEWGDGSTIIYSSECLAKAAGASLDWLDEN